MRRLILIASFLTSFAANAWAQAQPPMPAALAEQKAHGAQVYYLGKYDTLDGWAMIRTGQPEFYYATPGNKALVMGILFDKDGNILTTEQLKAIDLSQNAGVVDMMKSQLPQVPDDNSLANLPSPDASAPAAAVPAPAPVVQAAPKAASAKAIVDPNSPASKLLADARASTSLLWGAPNVPTFYAFIDPNCPHCQFFLKQVEPFVNANQVAVRIIPVAYTTQSRRQAAFILSAGDGKQRLLAYAKGETEQLPAPEGISVDAVTANTARLDAWKLAATPVIVYQAGKSGEIKLIRGRPLDIMSVIADLKG